MPVAMAIFDTYKFINDLKATGVPEAQAEVHSTAMMTMAEKTFDRFATKDDLKLLASDLTGKMDKLEARVYGELKLQRWMLGTSVAATLALFFKSFM